MKNLKKILCIALGLVCFAACGDDDDDTTLGTDNTSSSTVRGTEQISFIGTVYVNDEETSSEVEVLVETNKRTNTCSVSILNASFGGNSPVIPVIKVEDLEMNDGAYVKDEVVISDSEAAKVTMENIFVETDGENLTLSALVKHYITVPNAREMESTLVFQGKKK